MYQHNRIVLTLLVLCEIPSHVTGKALGILNMFLHNKWNCHVLLYKYMAYEDKGIIGNVFIWTGWLQRMKMLLMGHVIFNIKLWDYLYWYLYMFQMRYVHGREKGCQVFDMTLWISSKYTNVKLFDEFCCSLEATF